MTQIHFWFLETAHTPPPQKKKTQQKNTKTTIFFFKAIDYEVKGSSPSWAATLSEAHLDSGCPKNKVDNIEKKTKQQIHQFMW